MLLSDCVAYTARKHPGETAMVFGDRTYTFERLATRINQLANAVLELAAPGDRVAILSENRPEFVECYYGIPRAGMGLCFLNYRLNPREIVRIVNDAEPTVMVTEPEYLDTVNTVRAETPSIRHVVVAGGGAGEGDIDYDDMVGAAA